MQLQAVIKAPYYRGKFRCPWEVPKFKPFAKIRLHAEITFPEIGLVFVQLANYNQIAIANDKQTILQRIVKPNQLCISIE